jgi:alkane 1-monooxygenase
MLLEAFAPASKSMRWLRVASCAAPLLLPLTLWRAFFLGEAGGHRDAFAFLPLAMIFGVLTALDYLVGRDPVNVTAGECVAPRWLRALPLACVPLHLALLAWATHVFATAPFGWPGQLGWMLSMGSVSGILAINVAHELIHKPGRVEQAGGGLLLASVGYATFKIEHVLGHHAWVATDRDPSSAKLGESVYAFVPRAIVLNVANAFRLQAARLRRKGIAFWSWRNELVAWSAITAAMALAAVAIGGVAGLAFFAGQAVVAVVHLEMVNYIEHYGLQRATDADALVELELLPVERVALPAAAPLRPPRERGPPLLRARAPRVGAPASGGLRRDDAGRARAAAVAGAHPPAAAAGGALNQPRAFLAAHAYSGIPTRMFKGKVTPSESPK